MRHLDFRELFWLAVWLVVCCIIGAFIVAIFFMD